MRLPRFRVRTLMIAAAVAGLSLVGVTVWLIIPAMQERETARLYLEKSRSFDYWASVARELARSLADVQDVTEQLRKVGQVGEQDFKSFVQAIYSIKYISSYYDFLEMERGLKFAEQARESAWLEYDKLSDQGRIEWWVDQGKRLRRLSDHLARLKQKYEDAARRPWLPVPPDPPPPE